MTPTQEAYLDWITAYCAQHGTRPSNWDIARHFGVATHVARGHVYELVRLGLLPPRRRGRPPGSGKPPAPTPPSAPVWPKSAACSVLLSRPGHAHDKHVGSFQSHEAARAMAKRLNDELNATEGVPRHDGGPFAFYYVSGKCCGMPAHLADRLDAEAEAREAS